MTKNSGENPGTLNRAPATMSPFIQAIEALIAAKNQFERGEIKPVPYARERETHLSAAVLAMA